MITNHEPGQWQELQEATARILRECGFHVEVERTLRTARGEVEIDVYAEETVKGRRYVILCECKHWKSRIPQTVIHAFRTTVADIGANTGYVISTSGFQSGARSASELTNIQLVTWQQFQEAFEESWIEAHFIKTLRKRLGPLMTYAEPLLPAWFEVLPEHEQHAFLTLKQQYDPLGYLIEHVCSYMRELKKAPPLGLPIAQSLADKPTLLAVLPPDLVQTEGYREFLDLALHHGEAAIAEFRTVRDRNSPKLSTDSDED